MRSKVIGNLRLSLLPALVVALTSLSAKAGYIYDAYHSTGVADSKKLLQVRLRADATGHPTDEVEVRTLCQQNNELHECADKIVIKKDRLDTVVTLEKDQYQRLLDSIDKAKKTESKTKGWVGGSLSMTGLALAFPPAAPVAIPLSLLLEGRAIASRNEGHDEAPKKSDPRLETMSAGVIQKALSENVAVSDYRQGDEIELLRSNLKDIFSGDAQSQEQIFKNPSVAQGSAKVQGSNAVLSLPEAEGSLSGSAAQ